MDPVSQGILGATASNTIASSHQKFAAALVGALAGMAADLDVLISSSTDPLLALEYHRQFTHSLVFIPFGALICAGVFLFVIRRMNSGQYNENKLSFKQIYFFSFAGYATHALLDACTTYGTQLFWPFANTRVAWNNVSVVDPLFTLPLLVLLIVAMNSQGKKWVWVPVAYAFFYLSLGEVQHQRTLKVAKQLAESRGHQATNLGTKPGFANIVVWKSVYEHEGRYYVDAIRAASNVGVLQGTSTEKLELASQFAWLDLSSQQAKDIERFRWFSNRHLGVDPMNTMRIIDIRYSLLPNRLDGMWGVTLDRKRPSNQHISWTTTRPDASNTGRSVGKLWDMIWNSHGEFKPL